MFHKIPHFLLLSLMCTCSLSLFVNRKSNQTPKNNASFHLTYLICCRFAAEYFQFDDAFFCVREKEWKREKEMEKIGKIRIWFIQRNNCHFHLAYSTIITTNVIYSHKNDNKNVEKWFIFISWSLFSPFHLLKQKRWCLFVCWKLCALLCKRQNLWQKLNFNDRSVHTRFDQWFCCCNHENVIKNALFCTLPQKTHIINLSRDWRTRRRKRWEKEMIYEF